MIALLLLYYNVPLSMAMVSCQTQSYSDEKVEDKQQLHFRTKRNSCARRQTTTTIKNQKWLRELTDIYRR